MILPFTKLHGLGNDFIMIDAMAQSVELSAEQVAALCDRHKGIGADGVIIVQPSKREECAGYMHYINSDGTLAQMCGNGVRCFAKFLVDNGYVDASSGQLVADTLAGPKPITFRTGADGLLDTATVNMGAPILDPQRVPVDLPANAIYGESQPYVKEATIESPWGAFEFTCLSMGNPHAVTFIADFSLLPDELFTDTSAKSLSTLDVRKIGSYFEAHPAFPEKANIEFVEIADDGLHMRVFERGCGETMACGTGACAVNVASCLTGRSGRENDVFLLGGRLHICWSDEGDVYMTGPAEQSFSGTVEIG